MKFLKKFNELITESKLNKILYHGSTNIFKDFKDKTTFFADTEKFAENYADQKSFDYALDEEPKIYEVLVKCDILDIENPKDYKKLENALPDKVEYIWNDFGFPTETDKEDILLRMTGFYIKEPEKVIGENIKIGDVIPIPISASQHEKYVVYKIDADNVYTYREQKYWQYLDSVFPYEANYSIDAELRNKFKPIYEYVKAYLKSEYPGEYISNADIKLQARIFIRRQAEMGYKCPPEEKLDEFEKMYDEVKKEIVDYIVQKNIYTKEFNRKPIKEKLIDTWRYFENKTVHDIIVKLGYGGYKAREDNIYTYAIFNPKKHTQILSYQFPMGRKFDSWEDWENYNVYDRYIGKNISKDALYRMNRWEPYKCYKKGISKEEAVDLIEKVTEN